MSLSTHNGKNTFSLNSREFTNRAADGGTPIYDITSSSGGGAGDTKIQSFAICNGDTQIAEYTIPDWDPSWRVCVTGMEPGRDVTVHENGVNLFFTEDGYSGQHYESSPYTPGPWTMILNVTYSGSTRWIRITLDPVTGRIEQRANHGTIQGITMVYGVYSAAGVAGADGGGSGGFIDSLVGSVGNYYTGTIPNLDGDTQQLFLVSGIRTMEPMELDREYTVNADGRQKLTVTSAGSVTASNTIIGSFGFLILRFTKA